MGIIKAVASAIGGSLADQWLEVIEPYEMNDHTVFTSGVKVRRGDTRNANTKGTADVVSDGSIIHVYPNQFMILVDGGKIVDYTAEEGYYTVKNSSMPSIFNGQFGEALQASFDRVRYGGVTPTAQKVYFINLQEIKGIRFGTRNPINYFDNAYNAELFLRAHGAYSIKVTDPLRFYAEVIPRNAGIVHIEEINEQFYSEFMEALAAAINQLSADGVRISYVVSKGRELSDYMSHILDEDWRAMRGMEIRAVGIAGISYDDESAKLINERNRGAMLSDPNIREGYVQGAMARGIEAAGSNAAGSMNGFMGVGIGMQAGGGMAQAFSNANQQQRQAGKAASAPTAFTATGGEADKDGWQCACGHHNPAQAKFCANCGTKKPQAQPAAEGWTCPQCGQGNNGNFCSNCGTKKPERQALKSCPKCGYTPPADAPAPKFCPECGSKFES